MPSSILSRVGTGLATLVAAPIAGGLNDGARGFGVGLATGVTAAVTLPVAGAVMGTSQIISGIVNTPNSIHEAMNNNRLVGVRSYFRPNIVMVRPKLCDEQ